MCFIPAIPGITAAEEEVSFVRLSALPFQARRRYSLEHNDTAVKNKKNFITAILCVCLFFSTVATLISCCFNANLINEQYYRDSIITPEYIAKIHKIAEENLEFIYLSYELDEGIFNHVFTDEELYDYSQWYCDFFFEKVYNPEIEMGRTEYPPENFAPHIRAYYDEKGYEYTDSAVNSLAKDCARAVRQAINALKQESVLNPMSALFNSKFSILFAQPTTMYLLFAIDALLILLCIVTGYSPIRKKLYFSACSIFCGTMLLAVPVATLKVFDLPSRLALAESSFKAFFEGLLYTITNALYSVLSIAAVVAIVITVIAIILSSTLALKKKSEQEEQTQQQESAEI